MSPNQRAADECVQIKKKKEEWNVFDLGIYGCQLLLDLVRLLISHSPQGFTRSGLKKRKYQVSDTVVWRKKNCLVVDVRGQR